MSEWDDDGERLDEREWWETFDGPDEEEEPDPEPIAWFSLPRDMRPVWQ
jgi:hypothetical protein